MESDNVPLLKSNRAFWHNPFTVIFSALVLFFASQVFGALFVVPLSRYIPNQNYQIVVFIGMNLLVMLGLLGTAMKVIGFSWADVGWRPVGAKSLLRIVPAFLVYFFVSTGFTLLATKLIPGFNVDQTQDIGFSNLAKPSELTATFIALVILTPIFEEIIFRGVLFRGLKRKLPFWFAAIVTSLAFAVAHLQWNVAVDTFALSLIMCYLVEKSESIVPSILLHAIKNSLAFVLLFVIK